MASPPLFFHFMVIEEASLVFGVSACYINMFLYHISLLLDTTRKRSGNSPDTCHKEGLHAEKHTVEKAKSLGLRPGPVPSYLMTLVVLRLC